MALRGQNLVAVATGTSALTLDAQANESYRVKRITYYATSALAEDFDVSVDRTRVLQFTAPSGWNLARSHPQGNIESLTDRLWGIGMHPIIPVARGQTLDLTAPGSGNFVEVVYDRFDADDVRPDEMNGSESSTYKLFQVISNSSAVGSGGDVRLDQSDLDDIFPAFPGGEIVPARTTMQLLALFGAPVARGDGSGSHTQHTTRLKFLKDRKELFDQSLAGTLFTGDESVTGSSVTYAADASRLDVARDGQQHRIVPFDTPLEFPAGEEVNVKATVQEDNTGGDLAAGDIKLGLLFNVNRQAA